MKTTQALFFGGLVLVGVAALSLSQDKPSQGTSPKVTAPKEAQAAAPAGSVKATTNYPVIGYLETRDRTITIKAGPKGPLYSIKTADGKVLYENVSAEQLRAQAPELADFLKGSMAGDTRGTGDARIRVQDSAIR